MSYFLVILILKKRRSIMFREDIIHMSSKELKRLKVIHEVLNKHLSQSMAASLIGLSPRQVRRLVRSVRQRGDAGIVHRSRGYPSNRRIPEKIKLRVLKLYEKDYVDFGPTLASEKLLERDHIRVSSETLRQWLLTAGLWQQKRKRRVHRQWRRRKECFGEMIQMDGSHHDWLEGRGSELVLMGYIDDATGCVYGRFYDYEGTMPAMDSFKGYVRQYGLPISLYLDKHTTYRSPRKLTLEEELQGLTAPMSQFERAIEELGVELIHAHSPQAKGRIERLFGVLQDRLVKEMRLNQIKTKEQANQFLKDYLPKYNRRFQVPPANKTNVHIKLPGYFNLNQYLCLKTGRTVKNDNTISYNGHLYQIKKPVTSRKVVVQERFNGTLFITSNGDNLKYRRITKEPTKEVPIKSNSNSRKSRPQSEDHPWKNSIKKKYLYERIGKH